MHAWQSIILLTFGISTASATTTPRNGCINNLRQIDGAKEQLQIESKLKDGDIVTITAVSGYIKGGQFPTCPAGGSYTIGPIGVDPTCSIRGHSLLAPAVVTKKYIPIDHPVLLVLPPLVVLLIAVVFRRFERQRENQSN
jgi:hypothetical protein